MSYTLIKAANRYARAQIADESWPGQIINQNVYRHKYQEYRNLFLQNAMQRNVMRYNPYAGDRARRQAKVVRIRKAQRYQRAAGWRVTAGMAGAANRRTGGYMSMEKKFVDFRVDNDAFTTIWAGGEMEDATALSVSATAQGDGESQRDGRVYYIHEVYVTGTVNIAASESQAAPNADVVCRLAMVWDKQTNGAQLNAEDVFLTVAASDDIDSYRNLQQVQRFSVLQDKKIRIPVANTVTNEGAANLFSNGAIVVPFKMSYKFRVPLKVTCSGTTAAIASITDNSIHIIGTATATTAQLSYTSRCRFTG